MQINIGDIFFIICVCRWIIMEIISSTNTHFHFYHQFKKKNAWISFFWLAGLMNFLEKQSGQSSFEGPKVNIFKTCFYPRYPLMSTFYPNLNHSIWIWNEKVRAKTLTGCLAGSSGTELGQSVFGGLNEWIFKTRFYGRFPYESSLQFNWNHSFPISYGEVMIKILTVYRKSAPLKLCLSSCSLKYLTYQFFLSSKPVSIGDQ